MNTTAQSHAFYVQFQSQISEIRQNLESVVSDAELNELRRQLSQLESAVREATIFLPPYDQKHCANGIKELVENLAAKQNALRPKTKFAFNKRKKAQTASDVSDINRVQVNQDETKPAIPEEPASSVIQQRGLLLSQINQTVYRFSRDKMTRDQKILPVETGVDVQIQDCHDSIIDLTGPDLVVSALHLARLKNCVVLCRPIAGSALIADIENCALAIACHQFRMHDSTHIWSYLHVTSHPIIEQCEKVFFGVYNLPLPDRNDLFKAAQLDPDTNQYDLVDDFNWLKKQKSPNWDLVPTEKMITQQQWSDLLQVENEPASYISDFLKVCNHF